MKPTLGVKFITYTTILIILVAFLFSFFLIQHERKLINDELKKRGESITKGIANTCAYGLLLGRKEGEAVLNPFIESAIAEKDVVYAIISDERGEIWAHSEAEKVGEVMPDLEQGTKLLPDGLTYQITFQVRSEPILELDEAGFPLGPISEQVHGFVRLGITTATINAEMRDITARIVFVTFLIVIAAFILSTFFSNRIVRPVKGLVALAQKVAKGELHHEAKVVTKDEIGELADAFNKMTKDLKVSRDAIEEHSRTLEQKVFERTKELEKAYKELKDMQAQLIQSAKMTAIGQLGAGVAHELNNPLGGILGSIQYIKEKAKKPDFTTEDFTTCQKYLDYIERESQRCKGIVENLLGFSRKSAEVKLLNVRKVIDDTLSIIGHQLSLQNIKVTTDYDPDLAKVEGTANHLQQIFTNLILNAQQAMPKGGELKIAAMNVLDHKTNKPKEVRITVTDTGCGIAKEDLPRIFDPFFTTKLHWKGTGLGLSVSYQIVEAHKGRIAVDSELNKGTTFTITFPARV